jgi:hypothetical protein
MLAEGTFISYLFKTDMANNKEMTQSVQQRKLIYNESL